MCGCLRRGDGGVRAAVDALAQLGETYLDVDLGLSVGLGDEWNGGWGRLEPDLTAKAQKEINAFFTARGTSGYLIMGRRGTCWCVVAAVSPPAAACRRGCRP